MKSRKPRKGGAPKAPLTPCPRAGIINVIQVQLYDNGPNPGRGKSQHTVTMEVYCEGRLDLYKPYWKRTTSLTDPAVFMRWPTKMLAAGEMSEDQFGVYEAAAKVAIEAMESGLFEIAKLGHIGSNEGGTTYYAGQFILLLKEHGGGPVVHFFIGDDMLEASSFIYDQMWRPGCRRRKFLGFYDPLDMYGAMKRERAFAEKAERRGGAA